MRVVARPVLEGVFREIGNRQHQPTEIPDTHDHIRQIDLLYPAPLFFHHNSVINFDRLGKGNLNTGKQVNQRLLQRKTDDDACDARTGQDGRAEFTHAGKAEQDHRQTQRDQDHDGHFFHIN